MVWLFVIDMDEHEDVFENTVTIEAAAVVDARVNCIVCA
jgi:hypothetical protein